MFAIYALISYGVLRGGVTSGIRAGRSVGHVINVFIRFGIRHVCETLSVLGVFLTVCLQRWD